VLPPCSSRVATTQHDGTGPTSRLKILQGQTPPAHYGTRSAQDLQTRVKWSGVAASTTGE
jgi:hypothetical protein